MENIFFLFGGCPSQNRAKKLVEKWRENGGTFLITGYPSEDAGEVDSMVDYIISKGVPKENIVIHDSYETLSNVESLEKFLTKRENLDQNEIYASTGPLHWVRFKLIFIWEFLHGRYFNFFGINFIPSQEREVWYARIAILPYLIFTPKGWQFVTKFIRKEQYKLCKDHVAIVKIAKKYGVTVL